MKSDVDVKSDLIMMVENLVERRRQANIAGELAIAWQPPPVRVAKTQSNNLRISKPARDLIPVEIFEAWFGAPPSAYGLPVATLYDGGVAACTGVLIRADHWNPPEDCVRVVSEQVYRVRCCM